MNCIVYGISTDYLFDVVDSIERLGWTVTAYIKNIENGSVPDEVSPIHSIPEIMPEWLSLPVIFPPLTPSFRMKMKAEAEKIGFSNFTNLIDPTSIISKRATLASQGLLVNVGTIVAARAKIGAFSVLNRGVSIGHDTVLEEYVTFGPAAVCCGSAIIGKGTFIAAGAVILPKVRIGNDCIIGAGAVVTKDIGSKCLAIGNPARIIKEGICGYNASAAEAVEVV